MRTWTIILAAATLLLASCVEDDDPPKMDNTLAGSISYSYTRVQSRMYSNNTLLSADDYYAVFGFSKIDDTHVRFHYGMHYYSDSGISFEEIGSYGISLTNIEVHGRPYDVSFDYASESGGGYFSIDKVEQVCNAIKMEGGLYNYLAEVLYSPSFTTRDWSPPGYEGNLKITILLEGGDEYIIEITRTYK